MAITLPADQGASIACSVALFLGRDGEPMFLTRNSSAFSFNQVKFSSQAFSGVCFSSGGRFRGTQRAKTCCILMYSVITECTVGLLMFKTEDVSNIINGRSERIKLSTLTTIFGVTSDTLSHQLDAQTCPHFLCSCVYERMLHRCLPFFTIE